jgi:hypothetical protein
VRQATAVQTPVGVLASVGGIKSPPTTTSIGNTFKKVGRSGTTLAMSTARGSVRPVLRGGTPIFTCKCRFPSEAAGSLSIPLSIASRTAFTAASVASKEEERGSIPKPILDKTTTVAFRDDNCAAFAWMVAQSTWFEITIGVDDAVGAFAKPPMRVAAVSRILASRSDEMFAIRFCTMVEVKLFL